MRTWIGGLLAVLLAQGTATLVLLAGLPDPAEACTLARTMARGLFALGALLCVMTESVRTPDALTNHGGRQRRRMLRHVPLSFDVQTALSLMTAALLWLALLNALRFDA